jgi:hypothetical protein
MYVNAKAIPVETIPGMGGGGEEGIIEGVNSSMIYFIYYRNVCKCHNVLSLSTTVKKLITKVYFF